MPTITLARPFLVAEEVEMLHKSIGTSGIDGVAQRLHMFQILWRSCRKLKFPIRTFMTAMLVVQRVMLYQPLKANIVPLLCISSILFASKQESTPKHSTYIASAVIGVIQGVLGPSSVPQGAQELDEIRLAAVEFERYDLECLAFDLRIRHPTQYIPKFSHDLNLDKDTAHCAWSISVDMHCSPVVLCQPAHTLALASIVIAAKLSSKNIFPLDGRKFCSERRDVNEAIILTLQFYMDQLPQSVLATNMQVTLDQIKAIYEPINREKKVTEVAQSISKKSSREWRPSEAHTARYVLEWQTPHLKDEPVQ